LTARIDRLQEEIKRVLQMASVIGRIFPYGVLAAIAERLHARPEESQRVLNEHLLTLQREEMIHQRARLPELEYIFKHHLTREAAYNGLLRRERRRLHRQVAEALEELYPDRMDEQLGLLAYHWEQAGERERAIEYLRRAGEQAAAQFANKEAVGFFSRALELTSEQDLAGRYDLLLARERVYDMQGAREAQRRELATLEELAEAMDDDARRAEVALRQARYGVVTSNYPGAIGAAQRAVGLARATGDVRREVAGHQHLGVALVDYGDLERAGSSLEQALTLARAAGLRQAEAESLRRLGQVRRRQGKFAESSAYCEQALRIFRELGDRWGEDSTLHIVSCVYRDQGNYSEARDLFQNRLGTMRETGNRRQEGLQFQLLGGVLRHLGDYDGARVHFEQALRINRETGWLRGERSALLALGQISHHLGDHEAAREYCGQAQALLAGAEVVGEQASALTLLGHALLGLGQLAEAGDAYQQALTLRKELVQPYRATEALAGLARASLAQGNRAQAQLHIEEILSYLETGTLDGTDEPARVYLTCFRVLRANGDPRADDILEEGYQFLQKRAAKISDEEERRSFLESIAAHREIASEYALVRRVDE